MSTQAERIASMARLLGDDELIALANRGLLRRARKDLEGGAPEIVGEQAGGLALRWDQQTVVLGERPAEARCTCPAGGICRHILACLLHCAATAGATETAAAPCGAEISALAEETLERWAGKSLWQRARRELASGLVVECHDGAPFVGRIAEWNAECRWLPGGGLDGMLCSCHEAGVCLHRVAVVLAWQVQQGRLAIAREDAVLEAAAGAVRTRPEVCAALAALCGDLISVGFSRLAPSHRERLQTLAMAAHGVDLPRLERLVRGLAHETAGWLARDPQASDARLLERTAACWALATALASPTPERVGVHRSQYDRVQHLELVGAGLEVWTSPAGYHGLSVYFWDVRNRAWCTWSEARPLTTAGFSPQARISAPGPWPGAASPGQLATSCGTLLNAWRNRGLRLSGRQASSWHAQRAATMADLPAPLTDWREVAARLPELYPLGFAEAKANTDIVLLRPAAWLPAHFDTQRQQLIRPLADAQGRQLPLIVAQSAQTQAMIARIEALPDAADRCLLARLQLDADGLRLHPLSLIDTTGINSLQQGDGPRALAQVPAAPPEAEDEPEDDSDEDLDTVPTGASPTLARCLDACLALANAGLRSFRGWPDLATAANEARSLGLTTLANALDRLASLQGRERAAGLLLATWILTCQRQALAVAASQHVATGP
jgi:hypothetical protein